MKHSLGWVLLLVGCARQTPVGIWGQGPSRCEILADHTVLYTEAREQVSKRYSHGQPLPDIKGLQSKLFLGQADLGSKPASLKVTVHPIEITGGPARQIDLEWSPAQRKLKINQQWLDEASPSIISRQDLALTGWWKRERISTWMLLTQGGTMVQVGSQLRTQGQTLADYSRWPYLVSCWYGYELLQGTMRWKDPNFEFNLRTSATVLESPYKLENNRLTILGETYERVQNGFLLNWDKDGHPQVP